MNRYYDARAPWHDQYMSYTSNRHMEQLLSPIIKTFAEVVEGAAVLEIACGTGNWTQILAKRAKSVAAVDVSPRSLELAESKLTDYTNVTLLLGDAYSLDNVTDTFDAIFAADWWSHIPNEAIPRFLQAVRKRLHPRSPAIFLDMLMNDHFRQFPFHLDEDNNRISRRQLPDGSEFNVVKNFPSEAELRCSLVDFFERVDYCEFCSLSRWVVIAV